MKSILYSDRTPLESINNNLFQDVEEINSFIQNLLHSGVNLVEIMRIKNKKSLEMCKSIVEEEFIMKDYQKMVFIIPEKIKEDFFMEIINFFKELKDSKNNYLIMVDFFTSQFLLTFRKDIPILQKNLEWGIQVDISHPNHMKIIKDIDNIFPLNYLFVVSRSGLRFFNSIKTQLALFQKYEISAKKLLLSSNADGFTIPNYLLLMDYSWLDGFRFSSVDDFSIYKFLKVIIDNKYYLKTDLKKDIIQANELLFKHFKMIATEE